MILPRIQKRSVLEDQGVMEGRVSILVEELEQEGEGEGKGSGQRRQEAIEEEKEHEE